MSFGTQKYTIMVQFAGHKVIYKIDVIFEILLASTAATILIILIIALLVCQIFGKLVRNCVKKISCVLSMCLHSFIS
jgi:hypothetical protein